ASASAGCPSRSSSRGPEAARAARRRRCPLRARCYHGRVGVAMKGRILRGPSAIPVALGAGFAALLILGGLPVHAAAPVALLELGGAIAPITVRLLDAGIDKARAIGAQALVVELNTPGGLERSMRSMVQSILKSDVPVVVYVAPGGARAASAGVFITIAAHVPATAPRPKLGGAD